MNKGLWISKDTGGLPDEEMTYNNSSRIEPKQPKRAHQWFMDGAEAELFPSKKQAVEVPNSSSFSGIPNSNLSPWNNVSGFHSVPGQFTERLLDSEAVREINFDDRNTTSVSVGNLNMGRKATDDPFMNNSPFGLSISHNFEDPTSAINFGGIRKVKVSEVRDPGNVMSIHLDPSCSRVDSNTVSAAHEYGKMDAGAVSMGLTFSRAEDAVISLESYGMEGDSFISMAPPYNKGDNSITSGHNYKGGNDAIPIGDSFSKGEDRIISASGSFSKGNTVMAISDSFGKGDENIISMGQAYNRSDANVISMGSGYKKADNSTISMSHPNSNQDGDALSIGPSFNKGESNVISFGNFNYSDDGNASGRLLCNYDLLMGQPSIQSSETPNQRDSAVSDANALTTTAQPVGSGSETNSSKKKEDQKASKKPPANNFPSNVRSLLSTGILDGVPVKYTAWSREKELRGIIKGSGYLCGCESCDFSKVINAYEFERHASCKTKHPNNHIYFENGKTIYGIVQELRSTPQNMLFDVIQTITGSPINQKSFRIWKESFLAATRELQRIYGKDEGKLAS